jgi:hypothetical protein
MRNPIRGVRNTRTGFTLIELLVVIAISRHFGGASVDGHVQWLTPRQTLGKTKKVGGTPGQPFGMWTPTASDN